MLFNQKNRKCQPQKKEPTRARHFANCKDAIPLGRKNQANSTLGIR